MVCKGGRTADTGSPKLQGGCRVPEAESHRPARRPEGSKAEGPG
ncbi:hypothetical protein HMPREF9413_0772 [Paenibacillus sp. HGF7]|nr:hypothetical protein HMPREF9413_0772 [Paenibacillus sp. HGF7]